MLQFCKTIHLFLKNKKANDENMELAIKYYKFINDYAKVKKLKLNIKIIKNFKKENIIVYSQNI